MQTIRRGMAMAIFAVIVGLVLQCVSDPKIVGDGGVIDVWLSDLGITDGKITNSDGKRAIDSIGPEARAQDAGQSASKDWFTMTYIRNGGSPDELVVEGSNVTASIAYRFNGGKLIKYFSQIHFFGYNKTAEINYSISISRSVVNTGTIDVNETLYSFSEGNAKINESGNLFFCLSHNCTAIGSLTLTELNTLVVKGSYSFEFQKDTETREIKGEFEAYPVFKETAELIK